MNDHDQHCKSPWKDTHPADECVECLTIADVRAEERWHVVKRIMAAKAKWPKDASQVYVSQVTREACLKAAEGF